MRIYFDFLCWGLRKVSFGLPELCAGKLRAYQRSLVDDFWLSVLFTLIAGLLMSILVLVVCAVMQLTRDQLGEAEWYMSCCMTTFMFVNWLIGWFHEFIEEREDLIRRLKQ
jgi:ABC-type Fe3+ transport system permease subunit